MCNGIICHTMANVFAVLRPCITLRVNRQSIAHRLMQQRCITTLSSGRKVIFGLQSPCLVNAAQQIKYTHSTQSWLRSKNKISASNKSQCHQYKREREENPSKHVSSSNVTKESTKQDSWKIHHTKNTDKNKFSSMLKNDHQEEVRWLGKPKAVIKKSREKFRDRSKSTERPRQREKKLKCVKLKSPAKVPIHIIAGEGSKKRVKKAKSIKKNLILSSATQEEFLKNSRSQIESIIQYTFKDPQLLVEAFTHPSYPYDNVASYERLEFLGDAILDYCVTTHIYERLPSRSPNVLTNVRSALVSGAIFGRYLVEMGLHRYIMSSNDPSLERPVAAFVSHQKSRNHSVSASSQHCDGKTNVVSAPRVLGDVFESLAGAIYIDSGRSPHAVWRVYSAVMRRELELFCRDMRVSTKRSLLLCGADPQFGPVEVTRTRTGKEHKAPITVRIHGEEHTLHGYGNSESEARWAAAKLALDKLDGAGVDLDGVSTEESRSEDSKLDGAGDRFRGDTDRDTSRLGPNWSRREGNVLGSKLARTTRKRRRRRRR